MWRVMECLRTDSGEGSRGTTRQSEAGAYRRGCEAGVRRWVDAGGGVSGVGVSGGGVSAGGIEYAIQFATMAR